MTDTAIEWTDRVWNPTTGCDRVSAGCDNCYAMTMAKRLKGMGQAKYQRDGDPRTSGPGFLAQYHSPVVGEPLRWRKPQRVFVNSMSDLFHDNIPDVFIARVWEVMQRCPQHTFQVLTKRHARMRSLLSSAEFREMVFKFGGVGRGQANGHLEQYRGWPLNNVWVGVSAENQQWADIRIPALLDTPAAVRFVSCEPLLGPITLHPYWTHGRPRWGAPTPTPAGPGAGGSIDMQPLELAPRLDWLITGGESGPGARPMHPAWARSLRDQCVKAGVAFHFKQWGEHSPAGLVDALVDSGSLVSVQASTGVVHRPGQSADGLAPGGWAAMLRVGKKRAGRRLDGRTWDEYPAAVQS